MLWFRDLCGKGAGQLPAPSFTNNYFYGMVWLGIIQGTVTFQSQNAAVYCAVISIHYFNRKKVLKTFNVTWTMAAGVDQPED